MRSPLPYEHASGQPVTIRLRIGGDASTFDPHLVPDYATADLIGQVFLSLTNINNETEQVEPELAKSWTVSGDGLTWTFHLREDVVWSDGTPVTARDVEYSAKRAVRPETDSPLATRLYMIKNAAAIHQAALPIGAHATYDIDSLGVKALDDYTVEFTLEVPAPQFVYIASLVVLCALPRWAIEQHGDAWTDPANIVTNGPYRLMEWKRGEQLVFAKNPTFYAADKVHIECVEVHVVDDVAAALAQYEAGDLDMIEGVLPLAALARIRQDPTLHAELNEVLRAATAYIGFTLTKPPFDDVLVRKAFSAALDRAILVADFIGCGAPTTQFGPRGVFGAPDPQVGQGYDPEQAKAWLAAAGYPNGVGFPTVTYRFSASKPDLFVAMQTMWQKTLNVSVELDSAPWAGYFASIAPSVPAQEMPHMWYSGMFAAYPDENNFVYETFHCTDSPNYTRATCTRADDLAKAAGHEQDSEKRKAIYREVEQLMFGDEVRAAPFWQWGFTILTKPHIRRAYPTFAHLNWDTWKVVAP